jgi:hypothetical protein
VVGRCTGKSKRMLLPIGLALSECLVLQGRETDSRVFQIDISALFLATSASLFLTLAQIR